MMDSHSTATRLLEAIHLLGESRALQSSGKIENARNRYRRVERYLPFIIGPSTADELLSIWEGSLEPSPANLPEWIAALQAAIREDLQKFQEEWPL